MSDPVTPRVSLGKRCYRENEVDENILKWLKETGEAREKRSRDQRVDDADEFSKQVASSFSTSGGVGGRPLLYVANVMRNEDYLELVAGYLKFPVRTLNTYRTKEERKKVPRDRLRLKRIHTRLLCSCCCGECRQDLRGDKMEQAPCCERSYNTAYLQQKYVCKN